MPRHYLNYITYKSNTERELEVDLTDTEDSLRNLIEQFIYQSFGVQVQRGHYWLCFRLRDNTVSWIYPTRSIRDSFVKARRRLNGKVVVHLSVVPTQVCLKLEITRLKGISLQPRELRGNWSQVVAAGHK